MRTVKNLTGALVIAGMVAFGLGATATPASAESMGTFKGMIMFCSAIRTAASSVPSATAADVLWALYDSKCL
jgi:hypothetical protein